MTLTADEIKALIAALKMQLEFNSANVDSKKLAELIERLKNQLNVLRMNCLT